MDTSAVDFNKMWDYSKPDETREKFYKVLKSSVDQANLDYVLQLKTQIAASSTPIF